MTIEELEAYFTSKPLPATYRLSRSHTITKVQQYIETNLMQAKKFATDTKFGSAYSDLIQLHKQLEDLNGEYKNDNPWLTSSAKIVD
jgi:hypothetical protein